MFHLDPQKDYPKHLESKAVIRFQDCDPLRHLNNAKYFDYYFNAREDQILKHYGLTSADFFAQYQAGWVAYNHNISYIKSALVSEVVRIHSSIVYFDEDTIVTEYYMADLSGKVLKNLLWATAKYIDVKTGKRRPHHPEVVQLLEKITVQEVDFLHTDLQKRIHQLKEQLAAG